MLVYSLCKRKLKPVKYSIIKLEEVKRNVCLNFMSAKNRNTDGWQTSVCKCVCVCPCVCSYRINPQYTMENNRGQSIILLHQMQSIFPQLSPFSFFSKIPAHLPRFAPIVIVHVSGNTNAMFQVCTHGRVHNASSLTLLCCIMLWFKKLISRNQILCASTSLFIIH